VDHQPDHILDQPEVLEPVAEVAEVAKAQAQELRQVVEQAVKAVVEEL
jgi:hypothetical protein